MFGWTSDDIRCERPNRAGGCVRGSVVDGFAYNFRVLVPHDAVYDRSHASHAVNLFDMAAKYADGGTTPEILEKLRPLAKSAGVARKVG